MNENLKANADDHRTRTTDQPQPETQVERSGASSCSFSAIDRYSFAGWIQSHNPDFEWDWSDPKSVIEEFTNCISAGTTRGFSIDLEPVFDLFFSQGLSGMNMDLDGPEGVWLKHLRVSSEV